MTFANDGTYTVCLTVSDNGHCKETFCRVVTITTSNPCSGLSANYSYSSCGAAMNIDFTNSSVGATSYSWDFGDGSTSTATNPSHVFNAAGQYYVRLVAFNRACTSSVVYRVSVSAPCSTGAIIVPRMGQNEDDAVEPVVFSNSNPESNSKVVDMRLMPNPTMGGDTKLAFDLQSDEEIVVSMTDLTGRVVWSQSFQLAIGAQLLDVPTQGLNPGMYWVQVSGNGILQTGKLLVE
jgi:PKD repeat protein